jgi:hypothetical protein
MTGKPLHRPRHKGMVNVKVDLKETAQDSVDWINQAQDRDTGSLLSTP